MGMATPQKRAPRWREALTFCAVLLAAVLLSMFFGGCEREAGPPTEGATRTPTAAPLPTLVEPGHAVPKTTDQLARTADARAATARDLARCQRLS